MEEKRKLDKSGIGELVSKVPQVAIMFWVIKILATTLGETGGDAVTMTLKLGYAVGSVIFLGLFFVALGFQVAAKKYHPASYWAVVVATTTVGTTMSDYLDRTLGLGYIKSSIVLFCGVLLMLFIWRRVTGKIEFENICTRKEEIFYWGTILISNTLGTALGDFVATDTGLGFELGALLFSALILIVVIGYYYTNISDNILFWASYVLTRPLGATLGDILTKPYAQGGLELSRISSSLVILFMMCVIIILVHGVEKRKKGLTPGTVSLGIGNFLK